MQHSFAKLIRMRRSGHPRRAAPGRSQGGFTLVELLVVFAILALLASVVAPRVMGQLGASNSRAAKIQLAHIEAGLDLYKLETGQYPKSLDALIYKPAQVEGWNGPYLKKASGIVDPWKRAYSYKYPGEHGEYDLYSLGADLTEGGDGEDRDIRNW